MTTYLTVKELQALPRNERIAYTQSLHNNTMNNLNRINRIADDEIAMINKIIK